MSYKETAGSSDYRGGRVDPDAEPAPKPQRRSPCFATGCPAAGTMWPGLTQGTGDKPGTCVYHYGVNASDIPRVTQVLQDWLCVAKEIQAARRCLTGPTASEPGTQAREFEAAWQRLQPLAASWEPELKPGNVRTSAGVERPFRETYGDWARRLERFIGARVLEVLSTRTGKPA